MKKSKEDENKKVVAVLVRMMVVLLTLGSLFSFFLFIIKVKRNIRIVQLSIDYRK